MAQKIKATYNGKIIKVASDIRELYDEAYSNGQVYSNYTFDSQSHNNEQRIKLISQHWKGPGKILDVGCAKGYFLLHAKQWGLEPYGIDISIYAAEQAKALIGDSIVCCNVEKVVPFSDGFLI